MGSFVFGVLVFYISISPTWQLYQENHQLEEQLTQARNGPQVIKKSGQQLKYYNQILKTFTNTSARQEAYLLEQISGACRRYNVTLASLPPAQLSSHNDLEIETREIKVRGNFINIIKAIYDLEYKFPVGRISSVRFALEEDRKNKKFYLFSYIYIQNLRVANDERE